MSKKIDLSTIGGRLKEIRGDIRQADFARQMGVVPKTMSRYENNETIPDGVFLLKLHELFGVDPTWLLFGEADARKKPATNDNAKPLPFDEARLLEMYRQSNEDTRRYLIGTVFMLCESAKTHAK